MLCGLLLFQVAPEWLLGLFGAENEMMDIGKDALRLISLCFVFTGFGIVLSSSFQALGNGFFSMIISFVRQLVVLIPVAFLFARFGELWQVWLAFPIAELVAAIICVFMYIYLYKKLVKPLGLVPSKQDMLDALDKKFKRKEMDEHEYNQKRADILDNY
jgi:Na+-driven multidrug efflux pump